MIGMSTVVRQAKDQVSCSLNDEVAILNLKSTLYFGLDEVGAHIWQGLAQPKAVTEICAGVLARFDVAEDQCRAEVLGFLQELDKAGLIEAA